MNCKNTKACREIDPKLGLLLQLLFPYPSIHVFSKYTKTVFKKQKKNEKNIFFVCVNFSLFQVLGILFQH